MQHTVETHLDEDRLGALFGALANEIRLRILFELWRGHTSAADDTDDRPADRAGTAVSDEAVPFSTLQDAVGVADGGQFNYHLRQLTGRFIERTDSGYVHLASGRALYQAMVAGIAMDDPDFGPIPLEATCHTCGAGLVATYERQVFEVACAECGETRMKLPFLPAGVDGRTDAERVRAFERWSRRAVLLAGDGICPWCAGQMTIEPLGDERECFGIRHDCERCEARLFTAVGEHVVDHPSVVSFYADHGEDLSQIPLWELPFTAADEHHVVSETPWQAEVVVAIDGDELVVRVDDELNVVDVTS